jgi:ribosomal protein S18 acetylase RimI-like enzyme
VAQQLLDDAQREAARAGLRALALDTGLHNEPARALYERYGFGEREIRRARDAKTARALGGPGFVGYVKAV